jgi:hypothetical protein
MKQTNTISQFISVHQWLCVFLVLEVLLVVGIFILVRNVYTPDKVKDSFNNEIEGQDNFLTTYRITLDDKA